MAVQLKNYGLKYDDIRNEAEPDHEASIAVCIPIHLISLFLSPPPTVFRRHAPIRLGAWFPKS